MTTSKNSRTTFYISAVDYKFVNNYDSTDDKFDVFEKKYNELYDQNSDFDN